MSLTLRVALWLAGVWLLAVSGVLGLQAWVQGDALRALWSERNHAVAARIATELGEQAAPGQVRARVAAARFERGDLLLLRLQAARGQLLFERLRAAAPALAGAGASAGAGAGPGAGLGAGQAADTSPGAAPPAWFTTHLAAAPAPASAPLASSQGEADAVQLVVLADATDLQHWAWRTLQRSAALLLLISLAVTALVAWLVQRWHRSLKVTVAQAQALAQMQFVETAEPRWPELRQLARAMNAVVRRMRHQVAAQAEQVAQLQHQAQTDAVTGLPVRALFVARLSDLLGEARAPAASLLLVRVPELAALNERHGRETADRLLVAVADVLLTYAERIAGAAAGRLAGQDFALSLPAAGAARETAAAILAAIAAAPAARLPGARVVVAGCDGLRGISAGAALAAADAALARAEAGDGCVVETLPELGATGSRAWRELLAAALDESRVRLGAFAVLGPDGRLIHLECPLRVQVEPGGDFLVARRWLAMAARSRLMPMVDLAGVNLALAAIAADGQPRGVHVAPRSLASPGFARALLARLKAAGAAAAQLSIEWTDFPEAGTSAALREAVPTWRRLGVRVGVEHAGASPRALPALKEIGIDYVKVDARHLLGVAEDEAARSYVESLVALIHGLGLQAIAEGVTERAQLDLLWTLGFDGATGAAIEMPNEMPNEMRTADRDGVIDAAGPAPAASAASIR